MLIEHLYQNEAVPAGTSKKRVFQVRLVLAKKLADKMQQTYCGAASAYAAVEAGIRSGMRRANQRRKLLRMIQACQIYCGEPPMEPQKNWEWQGIVVGWSAKTRINQAIQNNEPNRPFDEIPDPNREINFN